MNQSIALVAIAVRDYDEAIKYYTEKLGFEVIEDIYQPEQDKRWVVVAPPGSTGTAILLQKPRPGLESIIGNQNGGKVSIFLQTDDFEKVCSRYVSNGVEFVRPPKEEPYGTVAVFKDLYGNLYDLIQYAPGHPMAKRT